jgi:hypothetical protein
MRLFNLVREEDDSGVSGTGIVAEGVEFSNGRVSLTWLKSHLGMVGNYDNITVVTKVHGHGGKTRVEWIYDTDPTPSEEEAIEDPVTASEDNDKKEEDENAEPSV